MRLLIILLFLLSCSKDELSSPSPLKTTGTKYYPLSTADLNALDLNAGDSVFLRSGRTYFGSVYLSSSDQGAWIGTTGIEQCFIKSDNTGYGINIEGSNITLFNLNVSGFEKGILIQANGARMTFITAHDNIKSGIESWGDYPSYSLSNIYIGYSKIYNNKGSLSTSEHSGSGIVLSGIDKGTVEYCEAYNNGENNRGPSGPVGIWVYDSKGVIIQHSKSYNNHAGLNKDGGGFDIDGGSQECIIQNCESWDNDGPGYGLFEYGSVNSYTGNIIRNNISRNDGRRNGYGAIALWASAYAHKVTNSEIYGNTFYNKGLQIESIFFSNVSIRNNTFVGVAVNEPVIAGISYFANQYR